MAHASQATEFDLLKIARLRRIILWRGFPYVFQAALLIMFIALAVLGWNDFPPPGVSDKLFAKSHLVNLAIWGLWWPMMIWVAVLFGRVWCMVCPLELVANLTERLGRRLGVKQAVLGKWLRSGALIVALYAFLQMWVAGAHLHRVPAYTSIFLWGLLATAGLVGFFVKDRAFCRGFCPVGILLGTYGRGSMLAVRAASQATCAACAGKECLRSCFRNQLDARSCPSLLNPAKLDNNKDCLVCGQCFKACGPANLQLLLRLPFAPTDSREPLASWPITLFVMMVSGFVTSELCSEWNTAKQIFLWAPEHFAATFGVEAFAGWIEGAWTIAIFPFVLWLMLGGIFMLARGAALMTLAWRRLALPMVVLISTGHMAKALAKFTSWVGYLPLALRDPMGLGTIAGLSEKSLAVPASLLSLPHASLGGALLLGCGVYYAVRETKLRPQEKPYRALVPMLILTTLFLAIVLGWRAQ